MKHNKKKRPSNTQSNFKKDSSKKPSFKKDLNQKSNFKKGTSKDSNFKKYPSQDSNFKKEPNKKSDFKKTYFKKDQNQDSSKNQNLKFKSRTQLKPKFEHGSQSKPTIQVKQGERLIMGKRCLEEVAKNSPQRLKRVYSSKYLDSDPLLQDLHKEGVKIEEASTGALTSFVESESHQSYVAIIKEKPPLSLDAFFEEMETEETSLVVMLDSIEDPQNMGALFRAAECFGADAVIWSKNRGVGITPTVSKASVGASELLQHLCVSNLADSVKKFQEAGFWTVVTDSQENGSKPLYSFSFSKKTLLILGSEGKGVQPLIKKKADHKIFIPMFGDVESLNVSQAASVFLSFYSNQHGLHG